MPIGKARDRMFKILVNLPNFVNLYCLKNNKKIAHWDSKFIIGKTQNPFSRKHQIHKHNGALLYTSIQLFGRIILTPMNSSY